MRVPDLLRTRVPAVAPLAAAVIAPVVTIVAAIVAARALTARDAAVVHLADALAENAAAAWEERDLVSAELFAAGALALAEQPRARGVAMRVATAWRPVVLRRITTPRGCALLQFVDDGGVVCADDAGLRGYDVHGDERFSRALPVPATLLVAVDGSANVLVADRDGGLTVFHGADGAVLSPRSAALGANVASIALGPDGRRVYVGLRDETGPRIRVWDVETATPRIDVPWPTVPTGLAPCPDGSCLVVGGSDGSVTWADPDTLAPLRRTEQRRGSALDAVFLGDGRVVVPIADGSIAVWRPDSPIPDVDLGRGGAGYLARRQDGRLLVEGRDDRRLSIRAGDSLELRLRLPLTLEGPRAFALSPDGRTLVVGRDDHSLVWWGLGDPSLDGLWARRAGQAGVVASRDGAELYTSDAGRILAWSASDGAPKRVVAEGTDLRDGLPHLTLDGTALVHFDRGGAVRWFSVVDGSQPRRLPTRGVRDLALLADGDVIGVDTTAKAIRYGPDGAPRWSTAEGRYAGLLETPRQDGVFALATDGGIDRLDRETGTPRRIFRGEPDQRYVADLSPDGDAVIVAMQTGEVMVLDAADGAVLRWWKPLVAATRRFAISSDRRFFVAGSAEQAWVVWDLDQDREVAALGPQEAHLAWAGFSADGARLYTTTVDARVRAWDVSVLDRSGAALLDEAERRYQLHLDGARLVPLATP